MLGLKRNESPQEWQKEFFELDLVGYPTFSEIEKYARANTGGVVPSITGKTFLIKFLTENSLLGFC
ncbi:MAG: hypothetical protein D3923_00285 [Candidatus Electrothrix sp. AR3]|nr:hypothetical protein [Candidatus Electrothrix sp. AR3]